MISNATIKKLSIRRKKKNSMVRFLSIYLFSWLILTCLAGSTYADGNYLFPEKFIFADEAAYRNIMHTTWKMPMRSRNSRGVLEDPNCYKIFEQDKWISGAGECVGGLEWGLHSALFDDERMDKSRFNFVFESLFPMISTKDSFLDGPIDDLQYFRQMQSLYMGFALYSDTYGVSDELDASMGDHFEKFVKYLSKSKNAPSKACKKFPRTKEKYMSMRYDSVQRCSDGVSIEWVKLYTAMGIVAKRADFIDEALRRLDIYIASTFEGGVPQYAFRSGDAPGYLAQSMEHLDDVGFMFEHYLGVDIWERRAGGHWNNSVGEVLTYSIRAFLDPSINIEYAKVNDILKGKDHYECCAGDENWKSAPGRNNDPIEIEKTINSYLLGTSWALIKINDQDLLGRIKPEMPNVVWRSMNDFPNKIVILKSGESKSFSKDASEL